MSEPFPLVGSLALNVLLISNSQRLLITRFCFAKYFHLMFKAVWYRNAQQNPSTYFGTYNSVIRQTITQQKASSLSDLHANLRSDIFRAKLCSFEFQFEFAFDSRMLECRSQNCVKLHAELVLILFDVKLQENSQSDSIPRNPFIKTVNYTCRFNAATVNYAISLNVIHRPALVPLDKLNLLRFNFN